MRRHVGGDKHEVASMKWGGEVRPLRPCRRRLALLGIAAWWLLPMLSIIVSLPADASGREPVLPAAPVLGSAGSIVILTDPPGARAWIGDRFVGTTPVRADSLAPGRLLVVLAPISTAVRWHRPCLVYADLRAGGLDTLRIDLRADGGSVSGIDEPASVCTEPGGVRSPLIRLGTVLPVAALGLGAAGSWSRHSADVAHRDYLRTLDRPSREDRLRRARRLDRVSVACWITAESCLAGAAWVWLRGDGRVPVVAGFDDEGTVRLGLRVGDKPPPSTAGKSGR